jgi:hypothetical protein
MITTKRLTRPRDPIQFGRSGLSKDRPGGMTTSRARIGKTGCGRRLFRLRRTGALLGVLALLIQVAAAMIPMPLVLGADGFQAASADLCLAPDSPLAHQGNPADGAKGKAGDPAHDCQICLTLQLAGHFLPAAPASVLPRAPVLFAHLLPASREAPALARLSPAAPRAPPAIA